MKLRILNNDLRLRLTDEELETFFQLGQLEAVTEFGPLASNTLKYGLYQSDSITGLTVYFDCNHLVIEVAITIVAAWQLGQPVSITQEIPVDSNKKLLLVVEKDLKQKSKKLLPSQGLQEKM